MRWGEITCLVWIGVDPLPFVRAWGFEHRKNGVVGRLSYLVDRYMVWVFGSLTRNGFWNDATRQDVVVVYEVCNAIHAAPVLLGEYDAEVLKPVGLDAVCLFHLA